MIYSLSGKIIVKKSNLVVIETAGIGFKVAVSQRTGHALPKVGSPARIFCAVSVNRDGIEICGFSDEKELEIFELLNNINGVGPKSALSILSALKIEKLLAAINQGRADLLAKSGGIGRKKAERIILELKDKIKSKRGDDLLPLMEADTEIESALKNLGYKRPEIKEALKNIPPKLKKTEERLKAALKFLIRK